MPKNFEIHHAPAHLIRRAHQLSVAIFMTETFEFGVTPVQHAILSALIDSPGVDQVTLAARVAFDAATSGAVIGRLEAKGWLRREPDLLDGRRKLLWASEEGEEAVRRMKKAVAKTQAGIMRSLDTDERKQLTTLLRKLIRGHEALL